MSDPTEPVSESLNTSNVVGINEKKRGRPPQGEKASKESQNDGEASDSTPKLTVGQIETDLVAILERRPITEFTPFPLNQVHQFTKDFRVFRQKRIDDVCLAEIVENTAFFTTDKNITADLTEFLGTLAGVCLPYNTGAQRAKQAVQTWAYKSRELKAIPPPWGFKSDPELCFNRLPYDPIQLENEDDLKIYAPYFSEMSDRISNVFAFWAMIGSVFFLKASRKQALWLWGPPGGGKSQLGILLSALMGDAAVSFENEDFEDKFWKADLIDKRTAYIDEGDPNFLQSNTFKALTGKRSKRINQKFIRAFEAQINTLIFSSSNDQPAIPNDPAIMCRVVPCWVKPIPKDKKISEPELEEAFKKEAGYIAGYCMKIYQQMCPTFGEIAFDMGEHLQQAIDNYESEFLDLMENRFDVGIKKWINSSDFNNILDNARLLLPEDKQKFKIFLKNRYPEIRETRHNRFFKDSSSTARGWGGIARKPSY